MRFKSHPPQCGFGASKVAGGCSRSVPQILGRLGTPTPPEEPPSQHRRSETCVFHFLPRGPPGGSRALGQHEWECSQHKGPGNLYGSAPGGQGRPVAAWCSPVIGVSGPKSLWSHLPSPEQTPHPFGPPVWRLQAAGPASTLWLHFQAVPLGSVPPTPRQPSSPPRFRAQGLQSRELSLSRVWTPCWADCTPVCLPVLEPTPRTGEEGVAGSVWKGGGAGGLRRGPGQGDGALQGHVAVAYSASGSQWLETGSREGRHDWGRVGRKSLRSQSLGRRRWGCPGSSPVFPAPDTLPGTQQVFTQPSPHKRTQAG